MYKYTQGQKKTGHFNICWYFAKHYLLIQYYGSHLLLWRRVYIVDCFLFYKQAITTKYSNFAFGVSAITILSQPFCASLSLSFVISLFLHFLSLSGVVTFVLKQDAT